MFYLIYTSEVSSELESAHMPGMLDRAIMHNLEVGISSCLLHSRKKIIQYLEGDYVKVLELFDRIEMDERHNEVSILAFGPFFGRIFTSYGLHYVRLSEDDDSFAYLKLLLDSFFTSAEDALDPKPSSMQFWATVKMFIEQ